MVTVVDKESTFTSDTSFDAIDALEELEIDDLDAIPEFIREDESNAHHLPAQPKQPGPKAVAAPAAPAPTQAAPPQTASPYAPASRAAQVTTGSMPAVAPTVVATAPAAAPVQSYTPPAPAPGPSYSAPVSSPTLSTPAPNPFSAPPASAPMQSFQTVSPVTTSTLPAYSPETTFAPQTVSGRHQHTLGSPLLDRHPGTSDDATGSDELETLWPGVHNHQHLDLGGLLQSAKKTPSFYIMIGFMAGAVFSLLSVWGYSTVSAQFAKANDNSSKEIVTKVQEAQKEQNLVVQSVDPNAEIVPISSSYEVKSGDTLVVIAMKNYKKVTPRLIDQIVRANGLKSANALSLGQTLKLPNYRNQSSKLAHRTAAAARARQVQ